MIYNNNLDQIEKYHLYDMEEDMERRRRELELAEEEMKYTREVDDE